MFYDENKIDVESIEISDYGNSATQKNTDSSAVQKHNEEARLVYRAKEVLIEYLKMTESQAHRYIEKQAMDMRITRREVAESIIKTYEN